MARVKCCGCNGTGNNNGMPGNNGYKHTACNGKGKVDVPEPPEKCVRCNGTGWANASPGNGYPCDSCGGTGWYMG